MARVYNYYHDHRRIKMTASELDLYSRVSRTRNGKPTKDNVALAVQVDLSGQVLEVIEMLQASYEAGYIHIDAEGVYDEFGDVGHMYQLVGTRALTEDEEAMVDSIIEKFKKYYDLAKVKEREALESEITKLKNRLEKI